MAISADFSTSGLLNAWQRRMIEDIYNFNQIDGSGTPVGPCGIYIQSDRQMIADALIQAVNQVTELLGFYPFPTYITDEREPFGRGSPYSLEQLRTEYGYVQALGRRATSVIQAGAVINYSDADNDGFDDTATITVNTTVSLSEIQVFFQVTDLDLFAGIDATAADARWRIEPVKMSAAGGVVTIKGHRALFAHPDTVWAHPYDSPNFVDKHAADNTQPTDFVTAVDVYRVYTDATSAIQILSDPIWAGTSNLDTFTATDAVMQIVDGRRGIFRARVNGCVGWDCLGPPERLTLNYLAGVPLVNGQIDRELEIAIVRLANTLMPQKLCTWCDRTREMWEWDQVIVEGQEDTPLGKMAGQVYAWRVVSGRALGKGGSF